MMNINEFQTDRLIFRPLTLSDAKDMFKLDSDPVVMKYLGNRPLSSIDEVTLYLKNIVKQYETNGIARWAAIEKYSGELMGWAGIKFIAEETNGYKDFYDIGYRFRPEFWGKGYATEATMAWIEYAKNHLNINTLYASAHTENLASQNVLKKCGFILTGQYPFEIHGSNLDCFWYELHW
ncbi:MAG: GNAT family N-acetyltransferase [Saprospiraceae bacterium]|nr:GNAT family N-acetyltransferase [Saprospiraceae bacterium]